ncbi:uncharacterized protein PAC_19167 [Phialocephala subalpina]|uniref:Uncharacterized protein n=1 Tax=Phialocephala subalpina TaxID=576137 RepID=A0A1L7XW87_9HELO|nr:uncharacterized protein PAC_19167 [Phialocephala subalpina]
MSLEEILGRWTWALRLQSMVDLGSYFSESTLENQRILVVRNSWNLQLNLRKVDHLRMMPNRAQQPTTKTEDVPKFVFEPLALKEDSKVETPDMYKMLRFNENIGNTSGYNGRMIKAWRLLTKHKAEEFIISGTDTETLNTMYAEIHNYIAIPFLLLCQRVHVLVGPPGKHIFAEDGKPHDLTAKLYAIKKTVMDKLADNQKIQIRTISRKGPSCASNSRATKSGRQGKDAWNTKQARGHGPNNPSHNLASIKSRRPGDIPKQRKRGDTKTRTIRIPGNNSTGSGPKQREAQKLISYYTSGISWPSPDDNKKTVSRKVRFDVPNQDRAQRDSVKRVPRELRIRLVGAKADPNYRSLPLGDVTHP